jgi:hypothetical protein
MKLPISSIVLSSLALLALTAGCAVEAPSDEEIAETEEALCSAPSPVDSAMAAIAVAAAREMGRLIPTRDFQWNSSTGKLGIASGGWMRCDHMGAHGCPNTKAAIALQDAPANTVKFPSGYLDAAKLRAALKANFDEQVACENADRCNAKHWDLKFHSWSRGSCFVEYFFDAYKQYSTTKITRQSDLEQYGANNMVFLGYPENKMLNFYVRGEHISIDPTAGLNEGGTTTTGSCTIACTKYSTRDLTGTCCSCDGVNKRYQRASFSPYYYLCR